MAGVAGGLLIGLAESFSRLLPSGFATYKDATAFAILLLVLFTRPHGLFGSRAAEFAMEG